MVGQAEHLRLLAEDAEDLEVIAAALQDAVGRIGDIQYEAAARRVTLVLNRFRWEADGRAGERVRAGLQFGGVLSAKARKLRRDAPEAVVELLTIDFQPGEAPGGVIQLSFAGGGDLRLEVECIDAALADISEPWPAKRKPSHEG
ncbi:MAG: DUF2948 family protein [Caulobacteraceae bacterium]|nr:DUF2948 family protein [Caulobacteraceae bacterium]